MQSLQMRSGLPLLSYSFVDFLAHASQRKGFRLQYMAAQLNFFFLRCWPPEHFISWLVDLVGFGCLLALGLVGGGYLLALGLVGGACLLALGLFGGCCDCCCCCYNFCCCSSLSFSFAIFLFNSLLRSILATSSGPTILKRLSSYSSFFFLLIFSFSFYCFQYSTLSSSVILSSFFCLLPIVVNDKINANILKLLLT